MFASLLFLLRCRLHLLPSFDYDGIPLCFITDDFQGIIGPVKDNVLKVSLCSKSCSRKNINTTSTLMLGETESEEFREHRPQI